MSPVTYWACALPAIVALGAGIGRLAALDPDYGSTPLQAVRDGAFAGALAWAFALLSALFG